ncbi:unnamed protein product [Ambrosiozyma monospora]|uniref:Unnamed protein product n=1 Tax=Ambrosiozyma monospora TaxID=43982 RepID=A0A9W6YY61_AMBMO|nr:unnamed protein product [Ambrosiozyma monospora]
MHAQPPGFRNQGFIWASRIKINIFMGWVRDSGVRTQDSELRTQNTVDSKLNLYPWSINNGMPIPYET